MMHLISINCFIVLLSLPLSMATKHWVLLVAGSNNWYNYRHQADICHAYQIAINHGIPPEQIVTMMYDDIAKNSNNPTPGVIINHPDGKDVYGGVKIDYKGKDVTPKNFLKVLTGDASGMKGIGSGRVIDSTSDDHVFVYFSDHGAPGIVAFPSETLSAVDLMKAIKSMYAKKQYQQMVLYIEACESGSMFEGLLPTNISVYVTTAANSAESSYACYYDKDRKTYLGDLYSVCWMEDSDKENLQAETLQKQFEIVKKETNASHVMEYGDLKIAQEPVADFQGGVHYKQPLYYVPSQVPKNPVKSEDVPLEILRHRLVDAESDEEQLSIIDELKQLITMRQAINDSVKSIVTIATANEQQANRLLSSRLKLRDTDCYYAAVQEYSRKCFDIPTYEYALSKLYTFVNLCEEGISFAEISDAIHRACVKML